jgi:hypothetical protein
MNNNIPSNDDYYNIVTDFENYYYPHVLKSGFLQEDIFDYFGRFYLIHPFEDKIVRNIYNQIVSFSSVRTNRIKPEHYRYILSNLFNRQLIIDENSSSLYQTISEINQLRVWRKTELSDYVKELTKIFSTVKDLGELTREDVVTLIAARAMNCFEEVFWIMIFMELLNDDILNIIDKKAISIDEYLKIYQSSRVKSDIIYLYNIIDKLRKRFNYFEIFSNKIETSISTIYSNLVNDFKKYITISPEPQTGTEWTKNVSLWNKLKNSYDDGTLDSNDMNDALLKSSRRDVVSKLRSNLRQYENDIKDWCRANYLDFNIIMKLLDSITSLKITMINSKWSENKILEYIDKEISGQFIRLLTTGSKEETILRSFIYGRPTNFGTRDNTQPNLLLNWIGFDQAILFNKFSYYQKNEKFIPVKSTITNLAKPLLFYYSFKEPTEKMLDKLTIRNKKLPIYEMSFINEVDPRWLAPAYPLLISPYNLTNISVGLNFIDEKYTSATLTVIDSPTWSAVVKEIIDSWSVNNIIWNTNATPVLRDWYRMIAKNIIQYSHPFMS